MFDYLLYTFTKQGYRIQGQWPGHARHCQQRLLFQIVYFRKYICYMNKKNGARLTLYSFSLHLHIMCCIFHLLNHQCSVFWCFTCHYIPSISCYIYPYTDAVYAKGVLTPIYNDEYIERAACVLGNDSLQWWNLNIFQQR